MTDPDGLPNGYRIRPPRADEAEVIDRLSSALDGAVGAPATLSASMLRHMWARPRFDLATDAWVVERRGDPAPVAYAQVWAESPERLSGFGIVHPAHH